MPSTREAMNISIIGTKGAGKGTQVSRLVQDFNLLSFSSGEALRNSIKEHTPCGIVAEKYAQRGEMVPDDIVNGAIHEWLQTTSPAQGIMFDGFPRTTFQAAFLEETLKEMGRKFDAMIYLDVSDQEVIKRLADRRVCNLCREEFHLVSSPFKTCPKQKCEGQHLRRLDEDRPEVISTLVKVFQRGIEPLLQYYEQTGRLISVHTDAPIEEVHSAIVAALAKFK